MGTVGQEIVGTHAKEIIDQLNRGIAAELNDAYRYLLLSKLASGIQSGEVVELFARTAADEWHHVELIMDRVVQLGGQPMLAPADAANRSYVDYRPPEQTRDIDPVTAEIARNALTDEIGDDELERLQSGWPER